MTAPDFRKSGGTALHPTNLDLDLREMGMLSPERSDWVNEHVRSCTPCAEELKALQDSRARFSEQVFPRTVAHVQERVRPWWRPQRLVRWSPVLVAPIALLLFLKVFPHGSSSPPLVPSVPSVPDEFGVRAKGPSLRGVNLAAFAREQSEVFAISDQRHTLTPGTELRFVVRPVGLPYVMVASIDGGGRASVYFPFQGSRSARVPAEMDKGKSKDKDESRVGEITLPGSIVLDAQPGPERVFALFSREPLDAVAVSAQLAKIGSGGWDAIRGQDHIFVTAEQASLLIEKRVSPALSR